MLDKDEEKELEIPNGKKIKKNFVGANMTNKSFKKTVRYHSKK